MDEIETKPAPIIRGKLSQQEREVIERLSAAGRTSSDIAAVLSRSPGTICYYARKHGLQLAAKQPTAKRYEITVKNIPPAIFRLATDAAARRRLPLAEVVLRCLEYTFHDGSPSRALDVAERRRVR
jgi:IS30 family transposase